MSMNRANILVDSIVHLLDSKLDEDTDIKLLGVFGAALAGCGKNVHVAGSIQVAPNDGCKTT